MADNVFEVQIALRNVSLEEFGKAFFEWAAERFQEETIFHGIKQISSKVKILSVVLDEAGYFNVQLSNGHLKRIPTYCIPGGYSAPRRQLADFRLIGDGCGVHWPQLDVDLSVDFFDIPQKYL